MHAQIVLFDGFDPLDAVAPYEVLHAGGLATAGGITVELVSAEGPRLVPSGSGPLSMQATGTLDATAADWVILPGASGTVDPPGEDDDDPDPDHVIGRLAAALQTGLPGRMGDVLERGGVNVATVCGGSLLLAMAGLIEGRTAVTHHMGNDALDATGVNVVEARVVDDGDLVTAGGVTSGLDLGLYLLEREFGSDVALSVERLFEHERRGTPWRRSADLEPTT